MCLPISWCTERQLGVIMFIVYLSPSKLSGVFWPSQARRACVGALLLDDVAPAYCCQVACRARAAACAAACSASAEMSGTTELTVTVVGVAPAPSSAGRMEL